MRRLPAGLVPALCALVVLAVVPGAGGRARAATPPPSVPAAPALTYADHADLADRAGVVVRAQVRQSVTVEPARAAGVAPGRARLYVEARTLALLAGTPLAGDSLRYLADIPLDARGKVPRLGKRQVLVFGRPVAGRLGELQLVAPDAQVNWTAADEALLRGVLGELAAPGAPGRITGVAEAIHVSGNLAGAGETQIFLATESGDPASITVVRVPGQPPRWSVSFSEVLDASGNAPAPNTLAWYRLACFLPPVLDSKINVSATDQDRANAAADYAFVREALGPCLRTRAGGVPLPG